MGEYYCARILFGPVPGERGKHLALAATERMATPDRDDLTGFLVEVGADVFDTPSGPVFEIFDDDACYGLDYWFERDGKLDALLIAEGIPFVASDDGKYEIPGRRVEWRPGMEQPYEVGAFCGTPVLQLDEFERYARTDDGRSGDIALMALIRDHFGLNLPPHPTQAALDSAFTCNDCGFEAPTRKELHEHLATAESCVGQIGSLAKEDRRSVQVGGDVA